MGIVGGEGGWGQRDGECVCGRGAGGGGDDRERERERGRLGLVLNAELSPAIFFILPSGEATINVTDFQWNTFLTRQIH